MTATSVMDAHPTVVRPTDTIGTAAAEIMQHRYRNLPVVDEEGRYLGIFGVNCLLRLVLPQAVVLEKGLTGVPFIHETLADLHERLREVENEPLSICMSTDVKTVAPDTPGMFMLVTLYRHQLVDDPRPAAFEDLLERRCVVQE